MSPESISQKEEMQKELLKSFHEEFSANQNHHQSIFIQVISAVLVVIIGYGLVFANTSSGALLFDVTRDDGGNITSYAIIHLAGTYFIAQFILILLGSLIMNIGYTFRRDQLVNYNIRKYYLGDELYEKTFGHKSFDPRNKGWVIRSFLPGFNLIFFSFIFVLQLLLWGSIIMVFNNFRGLEYPQWQYRLAFLFPALVSLRYFQHYYFRYKKTVK